MLLLRYGVDGECGRRIREIEREFGAVIERLGGFGRGFGAVVTVIDAVDLDRPAKHGTPEIFDRHLRGFDGALPGNRRIRARHIGDHRDLDRAAVRSDGNGRCRRKGNRKCCG
jgi:hypothetical protein